MSSVEPRAANAASPVKVLSKAAAVLDVLAGKSDMTPAELSEALGEPRSTVYRLLTALAEHEYVEPGPRRGSYQLGLRLYALGNAAARRFRDVRTAALPSMERLHEATRQTIFLVVRRGFKALCIERLDGQLVGVMVLSVGGSIPLHGGANARTLLAFGPRELWDDYIASGPLERFTDTTPATRKALFRELETISKQGYAVSDEDVIAGIASLGAPIFDERGLIRAAISLSGPRPAILGQNLDGNVRLLLACAAEISARLGHNEGSDSP
jgi:DNA-binding IclR family transcriptional regulator